jgi:hypothetical protein
VTGTSIVMSKRDMDDLAELGDALLSTGWFTDVGKVAQAAIKVLAGRELGLGPVESMRQLHIVEQRIELSADLLAQRVKLHPRYDYRVERVDEEACAIRFFQDGESIGVSVFDMGDATQAGLAGRDNWKRWPRQMLFNRAMTQGVKFFVPDIAATWQYEVPAEIEPEGSADRSSLGMVAAGGSDTDTGPRESVSQASDPTRGEPEGSSEHERPLDAGRTLGEGPEGSPDTSDPPAPPAGTEDAETVVASAGGSAERAMSSQTKQLLRHAADLRWTDADISAALEEAYPGIGSLRELDQEQARELIREWAKLVKATTITAEQKERLKPLASPADIVARAQVLFGADHIRNVSDLTASEATQLIADLEAIRVEQGVSA